MLGCGAGSSGRSGVRCFSRHHGGNLPATFVVRGCMRLTHFHERGTFAHHKHSANVAPHRVNGRPLRKCSVRCMYFGTSCVASRSLWTRKRESSVINCYWAGSDVQFLIRFGEHGSNLRLSIGLSASPVNANDNPAARTSPPTRENTQGGKQKLG